MICVSFDQSRLVELVSWVSPSPQHDSHEVKQNAKGISQSQRTVPQPAIWLFPDRGHLRGGKTVYLSGQVAWDGKQQIVGGDDLGAQTRQTLRNIEIAIQACGLDADLHRQRKAGRNASYQPSSTTFQPLPPVISGSLFLTTTMSSRINPSTIRSPSCLTICHPCLGECIRSSPPAMIHNCPRPVYAPGAN